MIAYAITYHIAVFASYLLFIQYDTCVWGFDLQPKPHTHNVGERVRIIYLKKYKKKVWSVTSNKFDTMFSTVTSTMTNGCVRVCAVKTTAKRTVKKTVKWLIRQLVRCSERVFYFKKKRLKRLKIRVWET